MAALPDQPTTGRIDERPLAEVAGRPAAVQRILAAAVGAFAEHGFEGTTTRQICTAAGLSSAGMYVYFPSKEDLLYEISLIGHGEALAALQDAVAGPGSPTALLRRTVHAFVLYHAQNHTLARVIQYELRELSIEHFAEVAAIRRRIDGVFRARILAGVEAGQFDCDDVGGAALAIESLAIDVARWFDARISSRTPDHLATMYAQFALQIVQAKPVARPSGANRTES
ncbi:MAG TPA: TetR/AcrR family transcriptional regulator [Pseudonocardiaceae bacterium]|nr:TetR/AcrR family transcriptional regulator [Pseudonocardiaceae bacterium]